MSTVNMKDGSLSESAHSRSKRFELILILLTSRYVYQVILGCFVFLIVPGIGLLYGGMARRKSALAMIFQGLTVMAVVSFQWYAIRSERCNVERCTYDFGPSLGSSGALLLLSREMADHSLAACRTLDSWIRSSRPAGEPPLFLTSCSLSTN
jgi:hypothetical protein